jgi:hypothetical protein
MGPPRITRAHIGPNAAPLIAAVGRILPAWSASLAASDCFGARPRRWLGNAETTRIIRSLPNLCRGPAWGGALRVERGFGPALPQRIGKWKPNHLRWIARANKSQHRQGPSFFQQASIDEPQFCLVQAGFQQPLVACDVVLNGLQTSKFFVHSPPK